MRNRINFSGSEESSQVHEQRVFFTEHAFTAEFKVAIHANERVLKLMGTKNSASYRRYLSNEIIAETIRAGVDPARTVLNADLRTQHLNLHLQAASQYVSAPVNAPSMTIKALSNRLTVLLGGILNE